MYWVSDVMMLVVLLFFTYAAWEISVAIKREIDFERSETEASEDLEEDDNSLKTCIEEARKTALKNMWLVCLNLLFCTLFDFVYTLCTYFLMS